MIEVGGLPALIALLGPFAVLLVVVLLVRRLPAAPPESASEAEASRAGRETRPPATDTAAAPKAAEAAGDRGTAAGHYLACARAELAQGRAETAAGHLRASIRAATESRNAAVQAEARLELAELARAAGDLTTACEHWQIARSLFHDLADAARLGETERLMRQHGCPTDWVLNDF